MPISSSNYSFCIFYLVWDLQDLRTYASLHTQNNSWNTGNLFTKTWRRSTLSHLFCQEWSTSAKLHRLSATFCLIGFDFEILNFEWHVMTCPVMFDMCMSGHEMPRHVLTRHVMPCYGITFHVMACHVITWLVMSWYVLASHGITCHDTSRHDV